MEPPFEARTDLVIRPARRDEATRVDEIVRVAFDSPKPRAGYEVLIDRPRWHVFVAEARGVPVGAAALFVEGDVGWCAFGCMLKEARRRGGQSALLAARVALARELGCRVLFSETGEAVPGDPQHSYKNLLTAGFREAFLRPNYLFYDGLIQRAAASLLGASLLAVFGERFQVADALRDGSRRRRP